MGNKVESQTPPVPCRYRDARQCARDTMLGSECPKICECACHTTDSNEQQGKALKPCPFCNASAFISWDGDANSPDDWSANCDNTLDCGASVAGMSSEDAAKTAWNTRSRPVGAAPADRKLYSELIHIAAEVVRGNGFLSPCAEDIEPRLKRADILKTAQHQESQLKDWAYRIRQVADKLTATTSSPAAQPERDLAYADGYNDGFRQGKQAAAFTAYNQAVEDAKTA